VAAVLALAVGATLRRSAATVTAVLAVIVLPYVLAVASILPAGVSAWLLRLTPAAAFAIQQTLPQYPQVRSAYTPANRYLPRGALWLAPRRWGATPRPPGPCPVPSPGKRPHDPGPASGASGPAQTAAHATGGQTRATAPGMAAHPGRTARGMDQAAHRAGHVLAAGRRHPADRDGQRPGRRRPPPPRRAGPPRPPPPTTP